MGELSRVNPASNGGLRRRDASDGLTPGRSLSDAQWDGKVLPLGALNLPPEESLPDLVSAAAINEELTLRGRDGNFRRRRLGWLATGRHLELVAYAQPLARGTDGRLRPTQDFVQESRQVIQPAGQPIRRTGDVPADTFSAAQGASQPIATDIKKFRTGFSALEFLPSAVRAGVLKRVPEPWLFLGQAINWGDGHRFVIDVVRVGTNTAVALRGRTFRDATTWQVDQVVYEFSTARQLQ